MNSPSDTMRFGEFLVREGFIDDESLEQALEEKRIAEKEPIGEILVNRGYLSPERAAACLAKFHGYEYFGKTIKIFLDLIRFSQAPIPAQSSENPEAKKANHYLEWQGKKYTKLPIKCCLEFTMVPILEDEHIKIVFSDPSDRNYQIREWFHSNGYDDVPKLIATHTAIINCLDEVTRLQEADHIQKMAMELSDRKFAIESDRFREFTMKLVEDAVKRNASDIHIEPSKQVTDIRFRIDGTLKHLCCVPLDQHETFVNTVFTASRINPGCYDEIHDQKMDIKTLCAGMKNQQEMVAKYGELDIRVAVLPFKNRGKNMSGVVLRFLGGSRTLISLEQCGYKANHLERIKRLQEEPYGLVILSGPVGSGKTTTLYSLLSRTKSVENKIVTVEDPVEMDLSGIYQVEVNEDKGITFRSTLRSFLRSDINVILVGETRDCETADAVIWAAMTGHKVYSTLHANNSIETLIRLDDLKVEPYKVVSALKGVLFQRLLRKLCPKCKVPMGVPIEYQHKMPNVQTIYEANRRGCNICKKGNGYLGRTLATEIFEVREWVKPFILKRDYHAIRHEAVQKDSFLPIEGDGIQLVGEGVISLSEFKRVLETRMN